VSSLRRRTSPRAIRATAIAAAAIAAHLPALRAGFVLDDGILLVENPYVRTLAGLRTLVTSELFAASAESQNVPYYRPLSGALYWVSWQLFGASAVAQHAFNLVLHASVAVMLAFALEALAAARAATLAAVLFAVHPATADTVAYVGGRQDLAGWICVLAGVVAIARLRSPRAIAAACFAATAAAASFREFFACVAIVLPLAAASAGERARRAIAAGVGGIAAIGALWVLRRAVGVIPFEPGDAGPLALLGAAASVGLRLAKDVVAPTDLAVYVSAPPLGAIAVLVVAAFAAMAFALDRALARRAIEARALGWCGIAIAAATAALHAVVAIKYGAISDRYAYEAAMAAAFLGAAAFAALRAPLERALATSRLAPLARAFPFVVAVALAPLTWSRAAQYRDQESLQIAMIAERPDDPESRLAESFRLFARGDVERAYPHCAAYRAARPSSDRANLCVGTWLVVNGRAKDAVPLLRPYALARQGDPRARRALFAALFASGDLDGVAAMIAEWEPIFPDAPDVVEAREELTRRRSSK